MGRRYKFEDYEVVWHYSQAQGNDLLLLLALVKFRQPAGMYATKETLASVMNCNVDTVDRSLKRLKALGELTWDKGSNHSKRANRYQILLPGLDGNTPADSTAVSTADSSEIPPQTRPKYPRKLTPLNIKETEMKYIEKIDFDFTPNSDCFRVSIGLREDLSVQQILAAKERFMSHPSFKLANREQVMSRWVSWLMNEPIVSNIPVTASRTEGKTNNEKR